MAAIDVGTLIHNKRRARRISQASLARQMGISTSYVADVERGKLKPSRAFAEKLALVLPWRDGVVVIEQNLALQERLEDELRDCLVQMHRRLQG